MYQEVKNAKLRSKISSSLSDLGVEDLSELVLSVIEVVEGQLPHHPHLLCYNRSVGKNRNQESDLVENEPEIEESDLPFLEIPKGTPPSNEPSQQQLEEFFTPENLQRLIYCPEINRDLTDHLGIYGHDPGFIFVCGSKYKGFRRWSDELFFKGQTTKKVSMSGVEILVLPNYDYFPKGKFIAELITPRTRPKTYEFLYNLAKKTEVGPTSSALRPQYLDRSRGS